MTTPATDQARTKSAYALQWNRFQIVRPEEDRATFRNRTGLAPEDIAGTTVLDGGCGMGALLPPRRRRGSPRLPGRPRPERGRPHTARDATRDVRNVSVVQGDLLRPPFAQRRFNHIYSLGVLDHTPDPRAAFLAALAGLLRPGGRIVVWVYPREKADLGTGNERPPCRIEPAPPLAVLVVLSRWSAPLGGWKRRLMASRSRLVARAGVLLNVLTIGVSMHPDPEVRGLRDTLDWYAPKYLSRHTLDEVKGWFADAGLVDVTDLSAGQVFYHTPARATG